MALKSKNINTKIEELLDGKVQERTTALSLSVSEYIRRLIITDLVDSNNLKQEELMELVS